MRLKCSLIKSDYREKDGYTLETVDVFGIQDHKEVVVIQSVSGNIDASVRFLRFRPGFRMFNFRFHHRELGI